MYFVFEYIYIYITNWCYKIIIKKVIILLTNVMYEYDDDNNANSMYTI